MKKKINMKQSVKRLISILFPPSSLFFPLASCFLLLASSLFPLTLTAQPLDYEWTTPSNNSSESMPCGGGDVGMNVWVENGDVLFYLSRSGCFDENNTLLKLGRVRLTLSPGIDMTHFRQILHLQEGYVEVTDGFISVILWADVFKPVVHVEIESLRQRVVVAATYENWRTKDIPMTRREGFQSSYKFSMPKGQMTRHDSIVATDREITFWHHNEQQTIFDATVRQQQMESVKDKLRNPLKDLIFGGRMKGRGFVMMDTVGSRYASTNSMGWMMVSERPLRRHRLEITMATTQAGKQQWLGELDKTELSIRTDLDRKNTRRWWKGFWQRSYIENVDGSQSTNDNHHANDDSGTVQAYQQLARNYTLFRYMLGCNSRGQWPTKFNGGLFTFDPEYVAKEPEFRLSPDYRNWGGGVHTAQNQRLVYWPMLKNGDFDLLIPQLEFYYNIYQNAEERSRLYWGHEGACLTEQIENYGLPCYAEYGDKRPQGFDPGLERNAWLEYEWDTCLEFCMMALEARRYSPLDIDRYVPMMVSCLRFFDEHYQYLANQRGAKRLDDQGKLILYPGSGGETYKMAYNSTSTIAALKTVAQALHEYAEQQVDTSLNAYLTPLMARIPDITIRNGMIAPALHWERVQNTETMQLYPVFPWRIYGVGRPDIEVARKTYFDDSHARKFRSHVGWKQDAIWAACLGLTDEAARLIQQKLGDGPYRFPAFWGPGFDWSPDHNWGGSGMIALQEMLLQETPDGKLYLFPAWPREWNIRFRLHASRGTTVEAEMKDGQVVNVKVMPKNRQTDVVYPEGM